MSTCSSLARACTFVLGRTLKPIIMASETAARDTSDSVIVPVAACTILIFTSSLDSLTRDSVRASMEPWTSALRIRFKSLTSPSCIFSKRLSRLIRLDLANSLDRCFWLRCRLTCLAAFSSFTATNSSPALGTPERPMISTGMEGPASFTVWPVSLIMLLILP